MGRRDELRLKRQKCSAWTLGGPKKLSGAWKDNSDGLRCISFSFFFFRKIDRRENTNRKTKSSPIDGASDTSYHKFSSSSSSTSDQTHAVSQTANLEKFGANFCFGSKKQGK